MSVTESSPHTYRHHYLDYYFCCAGCRQIFVGDPHRYLDAGPRNEVPEEPPVPGTLYTYPMDPEILQDGPGSCAVGGMALEPMTTVIGEDDSELLDMSRRFRIGVVLSLPVFLQALTVDMRPGLLPAALPMAIVQWIEFVLATPVVLWCGWPFLQRGWQSLRTRNLNMFTLIAIGIGVAWLYSVAAILLPGIFPPEMRHGDGTVAAYFEAAAVITTLVLLGQLLELRARGRTNAAIKLLLGLAPKPARILREDGSEEDIPLENVISGDLLRVRPGEKLPVDGSVTDGSGAVDESMVAEAQRSRAARSTATSSYRNGKICSLDPLPASAGTVSFQPAVDAGDDLIDLVELPALARCQ